MKKLIIYIIKKYFNYHRQITSIFDLNVNYIQKGNEVHISLDEKKFLSRVYNCSRYSKDYSFGFTTKPICHINLLNVELQGNTGIVIYEGKPLIESAFSQIRLLSLLSLPSIFLVSRNKKGLYTSVFMLPWAGTNIYHWFIDVLPRITILDNIKFEEGITIIIPSDIPNYQLETLKALVRKLDIEVKYLKVTKYSRLYLEKYFQRPKSSLK